MFDCTRLSHAHSRLCVQCAELAALADGAAVDLVVGDAARDRAERQHKALTSNLNKMVLPHVDPATSVVPPARQPLAIAISVVACVGESDWRVAIAAAAAARERRFVVVSCDIDLIVASCALGAKDNTLFVRSVAPNATTIALVDFRNKLRKRLSPLAKALGLKKNESVLIDRLVQVVQWCCSTDHTVAVVLKQQFARLCSSAPKRLKKNKAKCAALVNSLRSATTLDALVNCATLLARSLVASPPAAVAEHHRKLRLALLESGQKALLDCRPMSHPAQLASRWQRARAEYKQGETKPKQQQTRTRTTKLSLLATARTRSTPTPTTPAPTSAPTPTPTPTPTKKRVAGDVDNGAKKRATSSATNATSASATSATTSNNTTTASTTTRSKKRPAPVDSAPPPPPPQPLMPPAITVRGRCV